MSSIVERLLWCTAIAKPNFIKNLPALIKTSHGQACNRKLPRQVVSRNKRLAPGGALDGVEAEVRWRWRREPDPREGAALVVLK